MYFLDQRLNVILKIYEEKKSQNFLHIKNAINMSQLSFLKSLQIAISRRKLRYLNV